jgi:hypothetical protein
MTVRAFYLDLAQWALDDPSRWGPLAGACKQGLTACTVEAGMPRRPAIWIGPRRCFQRRWTILRTTGCGVLNGL